MSHYYADQSYPEDVPGFWEEYDREEQRAFLRAQRRFRILLAIPFVAAILGVLWYAYGRPYTAPAAHFVWHSWTGDGWSFRTLIRAVESIGVGLAVGGIAVNVQTMFHRLWLSLVAAVLLAMVLTALMNYQFS